jgi:hypothetical protein
MELIQQLAAAFLQVFDGICDSPLYRLSAVFRLRDAFGFFKDFLHPTSWSLLSAT